VKDFGVVRMFLAI